MKKIVSGILLLVMLVSLCGCSSSKYEEAVTYLNNGEYESALVLFEELAEKDYKDSAEMVKETKYQFVSNKKNEEDLTVYEYLTFRRQLQRFERNLWWVIYLEIRHRI